MTNGCSWTPVLERQVGDLRDVYPPCRPPSAPMPRTGVLEVQRAGVAEYLRLGVLGCMVVWVKLGRDGSSGFFPWIFVCLPLRGSGLSLGMPLVCGDGI